MPKNDREPTRHDYSLEVRWTGDLGTGTSDYRAYSRAHEISGPGKPMLPGSSEAVFRGDESRYSPEELLVASASTCHMLWYLHLCADRGIAVKSYIDRPSGTMMESGESGGQFEEIRLAPEVEIAAGGDADLARSLHDEAHAVCYVARSLNFPVRHDPIVRVAGEAETGAEP